MYLGSHQVAITNHVEGGGTEYTIVGGTHPIFGFPFFDLANSGVDLVDVSPMVNCFVWIEITDTIPVNIWLDGQDDDEATNYLENPVEGTIMPCVFADGVDMIFSFAMISNFAGYFAYEIDTGENTLMAVSSGDDASYGWAGSVGYSDTTNGGLSMTAIPSAYHNKMVLHIYMFD